MYNKDRVLCLHSSTTPVRLLPFISISSFRLLLRCSLLVTTIRSNSAFSLKYSPSSPTTKKAMSSENVVVAKTPVVWLNGNSIDPKWIEAVSGISCDSCSVTDISNERRRSKDEAKDGATLRLTLASDAEPTTTEDDDDDDEKPTTLVVKQVTQRDAPLSRRLGLAREYLFFEHLAQELPPGLLPKVHYGYGDFETGEKFLLMEDLHQAVDSGCLFGPGNPNNRNRDLESISARAGNPSVKRIALVTFVDAAKIHATFWRSERLLSSDKNWLRGQEWLQGKNQSSWEASQNMIRNMWNIYRSRRTDDDDNDDDDELSWDSNVRSAVDKAVRGISWESQKDRLRVEGHWTLVHGDFWPGNVMWMTNTNNDDARGDEIKFIDWEMVGLGSGPQELGQYVISNMDPAERKSCERELVQAYYDELKKHLPEEDCCTWDYCWREYKVGGVERWIWFLVYFLGTGMGEWAQFFHDQISAFMADHEMTESDITQPRP